MSGMSKKEERWRMEGFAWAVELANKAHDKGEDPWAVLNTELKLRNRAGVFIFRKMRDAFLEDVTYKMIAVGTMKAVALMCLWEEFGFGMKRIQRFNDCYTRYVNSLYAGKTEWAAVFEQIEAMGMTVDLKEDIRDALEASTSGSK